jgi:SNF2 family DNA or RNA helicase
MLGDSNSDDFFDNEELRGIRLMFDHMHSPIAGLDPTKSPPCYIHSDHKHNETLERLENNANEYFARHGQLKDGNLKKLKIYPFQRDDIGVLAFIDEITGQVMNGNEMGLGKTLETIAVLECNPVNGPILIISPVGPLSQWVEEIKKLVNPPEASLLIY